MSNYSVLRDKHATKLITKYGQGMTLTRTVKGAYNPDTGVTGADSIVVYDCIGFIQNIDSAAANQFYSTSTLQDTLIQKQDQMIMLSATLYRTDAPTVPLLDIAPTPTTDVITVGSVKYAIIANIPLEPSGVPIFHTIQVRR